MAGVGRSQCRLRAVTSPALAAQAEDRASVTEMGLAALWPELAAARPKQVLGGAWIPMLTAEFPLRRDQAERALFRQAVRPFVESTLAEAAVL
jgi:hypothetical protein